MARNTYVTMRELFSNSNKSINIKLFLDLIKFACNGEMGSKYWKMIDNYIFFWMKYAMAKSKIDLIVSWHYQMSYFSLLVWIIYHYSILLKKLTCSLTIALFYLRSAYGHTATLPTKEIEASMKTALSFGGGFDDV